jgi:hypothetical protein
MSFALKKSHHAKKLAPAAELKKIIDESEEDRFWWISFSKKTFTKPLESQLEMDKIIDKAFAAFKSRVGLIGAPLDIVMVDDPIYDKDCEKEILELYGKLMPCVFHFSPLGFAVLPAPTCVPRSNIPCIMSDLSKMVKGMIEGLGSQLNFLPTHILHTLGIDLEDGKEEKKVETLSGLFTLVNDIFLSLEGKIKRAAERDRMGTGVVKDGEEEVEPQEPKETGEMGRGLRVRKRRASYEDRWLDDGEEDKPVCKKTRRGVFVSRLM